MEEEEEKELTINVRMSKEEEEEGEEELTINVRMKKVSKRWMLTKIFCIG